ncbi:loricrin-like [Triticum aestivum]|uniref:loricrin-like n=1 Tax=Triticum aestivum TaxID=4565 RepID=UPI001D00738D|nr:loricrin-like [Triticum aestivum]
MSLSEFYPMLLSCEAIQVQNAQAGGYSSSADAAARQGDSSRGGGRPFNITGRSGGGPSHGSGGQHGGGHYGGGGSYNGGQQGNRNTNRNGGGGTGGQGGGGSGQGGGNRHWRPRCQVCKAWGHEALSCKNRYNDAFQADGRRSGNAATSTHGHNERVSQSQPWFFDTGATDHLTNDMERLASMNATTGRTRFKPQTAQDKVTKKILLRGRSRGGLYPLPIGRASHHEKHASSGVKLSSHHWH